MADTFFTQENCDRCGTKLRVRIMSWFTGECLCLSCKLKENELKEKLKKKGISTQVLEGCGYIPEEPS